MKKSKKKSYLNILKAFIAFSKTYPQKLTILILGLCLTFVLPGQNRYQTDLLFSRPALTYPLPADYLSPAPYPLKTTHYPPPEISAKSALVTDLNSKVVVFEKEAHKRLLPASTTKLMTAWVARQVFAPDEIITVPKINTGGSTMNLITGERITVNALLHGLLISSANDAALALAITSPGGFEQFLDSMNQWVAKLNLKDTRYANVTGNDQDNHYTSVSDLTQLSAIILEDEVIANIIAKKGAVVIDVDGKFRHHLKATNKLLSLSEDVQVMKTGWTKGAGGCLVAFLNHPSHQLISVVLGSASEQSRFADSLALLSWVEKIYGWEELKSPPSIQVLATAGT
jgi:D-alanyl-D-alanine carboxypeptidase (penicillin-binding protein 5/6)